MQLPKGQLASGYDGSIIDSDIYGYVVNYSLKKWHILSISDTNYVFSVRKWENGNYSTIDELANIVIYDSQFGMIGVEGSVKRFTMEAETIDGVLYESCLCGEKELHSEKVNETVIPFEFNSDEGIFKVFFLTTDCRPWLNWLEPA